MAHIRENENYLWHGAFSGKYENIKYLYTSLSAYRSNYKMLRILRRIVGLVVFFCFLFEARILQQ